jgi:hypothetical protein
MSVDQNLLDDLIAMFGIDMERVLEPERSNGEYNVNFSVGSKAKMSAEERNKIVKKYYEEQKVAKEKKESELREKACSEGRNHPIRSLEL